MVTVKDIMELCPNAGLRAAVFILQYCGRRSQEKSGGGGANNSGAIPPVTHKDG